MWTETKVLIFNNIFLIFYDVCTNFFLLHACDAVSSFLLFDEICN